MGLEDESWLLVLLDKRHHAALDKMCEEMEMSQDTVVKQAIRVLELYRANLLVFKDPKGLPPAGCGWEGID